MKSHILLTAFLALATISFTSTSHAHPCDTGMVPLGVAYIRSNPIYALYLGDLPGYLPQNAQHFARNGDAIQCARILAREFGMGAAQRFDRAELERAHQLRVDLERMGIPGGQAPPTASGMLMQMAMHLDRLARVLPSAAAGDYTAYYTPTNEYEQTQIFAEQLLQQLLRDPSMLQIMQQMEPQIRAAAEQDALLFINMAESVTAN